MSNLTLSPVMAFIDTSETVTVVEVPQIYARYIQPGQKVEITFKYLPGEVFTGSVETVLQAIASGQAAPSGTAAAPVQISAAPFVVRVKLDDPEASASACRRAAPAARRSTPTTSRPATSSARWCCGRRRS